MKRVDIDHPWMQEMISRRSGGDPDYVAGVRAFLTGGQEPPDGGMARKGWRDAYDMSEHISEVAADFRADAIEEEAKLEQYRSFVSRCSAAGGDPGESAIPATAREAVQEHVQRRSAEKHAKLNQFIEENPKLFGHYEGLPRADLIRELMLGEMRQRECAAIRDQQIRPWLEQHPEVTARIEERIRRASAASGERACINTAKQEAMKQVARSNGIRA